MLWMDGAMNGDPPSRLMPILRHFFRRQYWHWFRWWWYMMPLIKSSGSSKNGSGSNSRKVPPFKKSRSANRVLSRSIFLKKICFLKIVFLFSRANKKEPKQIKKSGIVVLVPVAALSGHGFHQRYESVKELLLSNQYGTSTAPFFTTFG